MAERRSTIPSPDEVLDRLETDDERTLEERLAEGTRDGSIALLGGGVVLVGAIRSLLRGRLRGVVQGAVGLVLVRYGLRKRGARSRTGPDSGSTGKEVSDEARERDEIDGQPRSDPVEEAESGESSSDVVFTDDRDEPRSKPELDADVEDPRRNDDDEPVEIDVSEASLAGEASEATGPDPEQAQPTRTEDTEPESSPDRDASRVEGDVSGGESDEGEADEGPAPDAEEESDEDDGPLP